MKDQHKMGVLKMPKLLWQMGLPMIISMIIQSVYNIVDTAFVINMGEDGIYGNLALTYAFPIQLLIIALGVGTGVGINAMLSKKLGEKDEEAAEIQTIVVYAIMIASIGYIFMSISIAIQGVLQALRFATLPLIISLLRLAIIVLPIAYLFTLSNNAIYILWWTFPITELITMLCAIIFLKFAYLKKVYQLAIN